MATTPDPQPHLPDHDDWLWLLDMAHLVSKDLYIGLACVRDYGATIVDGPDGPQVSVPNTMPGHLLKACEKNAFNWEGRQILTQMLAGLAAERPR